MVGGFRWAATIICHREERDLLSNIPWINYRPSLSDRFVSTGGLLLYIPRLFAPLFAFINYLRCRLRSFALLLCCLLRIRSFSFNKIYIDVSI